MSTHSRIVAFTKDWDDVPTCTTHVLREMAKTMPVLWIESIGTRKPSLAAGKDLRRIARRLKRALAGAVSKENGLRVLSPFAIPKTESAWGRRLNRFLMGCQIGRELKRMGTGPVEYWCFVPNAVDLLPAERAAADSGSRPCSARPRVIYYCVDDWSKFHNLDGAWLAAKEEMLLRRADVVFAPSRFLEAKCRRLTGGRVHYVPHGVEFGAFSRALGPATAVPADIAALPKPVVGFYGNLHPWVDFGLVGRLAKMRPQWSFVLIGEVFCDVSEISALPNICLPGRREHATLPEYCKAFDAAIIPYDMKQARMESVNPVKTKELLAAGVPVAAADVPELRGYGDDVIICRTDDDWISALEKQVSRRDRAEISERMATEDWSRKVETMRAVVSGTEESRAEAVEER